MTLLARGLILAEEVRFQTGSPRLESGCQTGYPKSETRNRILNRIPKTRNRNTLPETRYPKRETRAHDAAGARAHPG